MPRRKHTQEISDSIKKNTAIVQNDSLKNAHSDLPSFSTANAKTFRGHVKSLNDANMVSGTDTNNNEPATLDRNVAKSSAPMQITINGHVPTKKPHQFCDVFVTQVIVPNSKIKTTPLNLKSESSISIGVNETQQCCSKIPSGEGSQGEPVVPTILKNRVVETSSTLPISIHSASNANVEKLLKSKDVSSSVGKISFLQEILENKSYHPMESATTQNVSQLEKSAPHRLDREAAILFNKDKFVHLKPKLHVTIPVHSEDVNPTSYPTDSNKVAISKIPSPQILEQHISKIISQNAAIVTLDPMWSRRYHKQTSPSPAEIDSKEAVGNNSLSATEKDIPLYNNETISKSKLHSALLGSHEEVSETPVYHSKEKHSLTEGQSCDVPLSVASEIKRSHVSPMLLSTSLYSNISSEDYLKGSAVRSLLSLKQGSYQSTLEEEDGFCGHPRNPEGSIIKDLLLKNKSQDDLSYRASSYDNWQGDQLNEKSHFASNVKPEIISKHIPLDFTIKSESSLSKLEEHDNSVGQILKKQLLMPLASKSSQRKRKVSNETSTDFLNNHIVERPFQEPYRCRSQSMHLFGGEIQEVIDGLQTKRIRVTNTDFSGPLKRSKTMDNLGTNKTTALVTISQLGHNSGGTVLARKHSISPILNIHPDILAKSGTKTVPKHSVLENDSAAQTSSYPAYAMLPVTLQNQIRHFLPGPTSCGMQIKSTSCDSSAVECKLPAKDISAGVVVPTFLFTPSSPTTEDEEKRPPPSRPTSLLLPKRPFTMVSANLVSPDTPRPKKSCAQLYLNGTLYTYLGLKCSTRSTYCCVYRPQPMFVPQRHRLSMYSNWQTVPGKEEPLLGLLPGELMALYDSRQRGGSAVTVSSASDSALVLTHSSYWRFRSVEEAKTSSDGEEEQECIDRQRSETVTSSLSDKCVPGSEGSSGYLDTDYQTSDLDALNSEEEEEEGHPKRVRIFKGGFKSNEEYTYIRGRGRGKYICEECGIRCKKPSMLKKHIRTHTDLRPFKCRHCSFAFKTKGNLTKHMKSKAHHKKCTELGIPVTEEPPPEQLRPSEDEEDEDDSEESDEESESDTSSMNRSISNGRAEDGQESQRSMEQEAAHSLLHLSAHHWGSDDPEDTTCSEAESMLGPQRPRSYSAGVPPSEQMPPRESYGRRYSISVVREARRTTAPEWVPGDAEQPMDLSVTRDVTRYRTTVVTAQSGDEALPILSPPEEDAADATLLHLPEDHESLIGRPLIYVRDREPEEEPLKLDIAEYETCTQVSAAQVEVNTFYFSQEGSSNVAPSTVPSESELSACSSKPFSTGTSSEGRCVCRICNKEFARSSHLRLHVNIHYFERPFRCDNCAVSFRTKGHLQKHKRSLSHYNKVNMNLTFGTPSVDNPRPFKCEDCKIAFRIHGHLAKHLRSKMHIMKLECLGKLPFGMYAEMERSGVSLNEIDTTDCSHSLESLQAMAQRLYRADPRRMRWQPPPDPAFDPTLPEVCATPKPETVSSEIREAVESAAADTSLEGEPPLNRSGTCHICSRLFKSAKFLQVHLYCDHPEWSGALPSADGAPQCEQHFTTHTERQQHHCDWLTDQNKKLK